MKTMYSIAAIALIASAALTTPALARDNQRGQRAEIRQDTREIRGDRKELRQDSREVRQDVREGDRREAREDRRELREDARETREDVRERREDARDNDKNPRRARHHRLKMACDEGNAKACSLLEGKPNKGGERGER